MTRLAPMLVALALLAGSAAAFAVAERLKLEPTPITGTRVVKDVLSPVCACATRTTRISFRLRRRATLRVEVLDEAERVVRTLAAGRRGAPGRVAFEWNGRDDAGRIVRDGTYRLSVELDGDRTIVLPNRIALDTVRPRITLLRLHPRVFSPDGDGRREYVQAFYRVSERANALLFVDGELWLDTLFRPLEGKLVWFGRRGKGRPLPPGVYRVQLGARDRAGNLGARTRPVAVRIRYPGGRG